MNIEAAMAEADAARASEAVEEGRKSLLIAPMTNEIPNDGILNYVTIASVYDIKHLPAHSVVMVGQADDPAYRVIIENQRVFGVALRVLTGVPGADYSTDFDQLIWSLERVAYAPLVSEIALAREVDAQAKSNNATQHDRERAQFTRADGSVKKQTAFDVADNDDGEFESNDE